MWRVCASRHLHVGECDRRRRIDELRVLEDEVLAEHAARAEEVPAAAAEPPAQDVERAHRDALLAHKRAVVQRARELRDEGLLLALELARDRAVPVLHLRVEVPDSLEPRPVGLEGDDAAQHGRHALEDLGVAADTVHLAAVVEVDAQPVRGERRDGWEAGQWVRELGGEAGAGWGDPSRTSGMHAHRTRSFLSMPRSCMNMFSPSMIRWKLAVSGSMEVAMAHIWPMV